MTSLIYGIIATKPGISISLDKTGVEGQSLHVVTHNGHGAVCSKIAVPTPPVTVACIQDFNAVIQYLADQVPTIPMRYGSIFDDHQGIVDFLAQHSKRNSSLLLRIQGCVEISIRITHAQMRSAGGSSTDETDGRKLTPSGRSYLEHRRKCYDARDKNKDAVHALASFHQQAFQGLYQEVKRENASTGAFPLPLAETHPVQSLSISLHFLVPRNRVEDFMAAFHRLKQTSKHTLFLSGPWPAYNFVTEEGNRGT